MKKSTRIVAICMCVIILSFAFVGCRNNEEEAGNELQNEIIFENIIQETLTDDPDIIDEFAGETMEVMMYFSDSDLNLMAEERSIPKVEGIARRTVEEMITGPSSAALTALLPEGTVLLDINVKESGLAIVNFNKAFTTFPNQPEAEAGIYSIVNTLTEFPTVKEVQFWIEGEIVEDISGVAVETPLKRDESKIKGE